MNAGVGVEVNAGVGVGLGVGVGGLVRVQLDCLGGGDAERDSIYCYGRGYGQDVVCGVACRGLVCYVLGRSERLR